MVSTLYDVCDWIPVRNNSVFTADVVEYVGLISASSFARRHFIQHHSSAEEKYQLVNNTYINNITKINKTSFLESSHQTGPKSAIKP